MEEVHHERTIKTSLGFLGDYINGRWVRSENTDAEWIVQSPSDLKDKVIKLGGAIRPCRSLAVDAARKRFLPWARLGVEGRKPYFMRLKEVFAARAGEVAELIARETGKPLWESKTEAAALANKIDITLGYSLKLVQKKKSKTRFRASTATSATNRAA